MTFGNFPHTLGIWACVENCENLKKMSFKGLEKRVRNISTDVAILRCWRGCEWRWIWIEMILWLCGINVFFSFQKPLKSLVPNPDMCKMRQKIIASMP